MRGDGWFAGKSPVWFSLDVGGGGREGGVKCEVYSTFVIVGTIYIYLQ